MTIIAKMFRCRDCGQVYPLVPFYKAAAPHGPDKACSSQDWVPVRMAAYRCRECGEVVDREDAGPVLDLPCCVADDDRLEWTRHDRV